MNKLLNCACDHIKHQSLFSAFALSVGYIFYTQCQLKALKKKTKKKEKRRIHLLYPSLASTHRKGKKDVVSLHWGHSSNSFSYP